MDQTADLQRAVERLRAWIETREFAGYEPFDLLNAPSLRGRWARQTLVAICLIQAGKRFGGQGLRKLFRVPLSRNPKALGLALSAYCDLARCGHDVAGQAAGLKETLRQLRAPREACYCWGYDWDYVSLRGSRLPAFSANCIATCFCANALLDMGERFNDPEARAMGESAAQFIVSRLHRSYESDDAVCFSYTPHDRTQIYNSSALAGALLARVGAAHHNTEYLSLARKAMVYLERAQLPGGGWYYGHLRRQRWIDSFHSSYNVTALLDYQRFTADRSFDHVMQKGHDYYKAAFFTAEGAPRYFHNRTFPIDIHACSQALLHFTAFAQADPQAREAAWQTFSWTMRHMAAADGSFYYQRHRLWTNRTPYMRWGQAWMLRALCAMLGL